MSWTPSDLPPWSECPISRMARAKSGVGRSLLDTTKNPFRLSLEIGTPKTRYASKYRGRCADPHAELLAQSPTGHRAEACTRRDRGPVTWLSGLREDVF